MNRIITIGREFGSGGRELGRRLAEELGIDYYDREIVERIVERTPFTEGYVMKVGAHRPRMLYPVTTGKSFMHMADYTFRQAQEVFREQSRVLREMAERSDCVIVGRCADYVLREFAPYRIFVCADIESRVKRCREREQGTLSVEAIRKNIASIDKGRSGYYSFYCEGKWGSRENYDLCVNTSRTDIALLAKVLSGLFR